MNHMKMPLLEGEQSFGSIIGQIKNERGPAIYLTAMADAYEKTGDLPQKVNINLIINDDFSSLENSEQKDLINQIESLFIHIRIVKDFIVCVDVRKYEEYYCRINIEEEYKNVLV